MAASFSRYLSSVFSLYTEKPTAIAGFEEGKERLTDEEGVKLLPKPNEGRQKYDFIPKCLQHCDVWSEQISKVTHFLWVEITGKINGALLDMR